MMYENDVAVECSYDETKVQIVGWEYSVGFGVNFSPTEPTHRVHWKRPKFADAEDDLLAKMFKLSTPPAPVNQEVFRMHIRKNSEIPEGYIVLWVDDEPFAIIKVKE